jgi:hypothetical protein
MDKKIGPAALVQQAIKMLSTGMYTSSYESQIIETLEAAKAAMSAQTSLPVYYIVKGMVTDDEAHAENLGIVGDTEWQISDGPAGERGSSACYLDLEEAIKAHSPAVFIFDDGNAPQIWRDKHDILALDDECYPQVTFGHGHDASDGVQVTHEQATAIFRKWKCDQQGMTWKQFASLVQPTFGMDGAVTLPWCNMMLVIERDGHVHT